MATKLTVIRPTATDRQRPRRTAHASSRRSLAGAAVPLLVAACVFVLAIRNGTYDGTSREIVAIAVWWLLVLATAIGLFRYSRPPAAALWAGGGLAGLAALAGLSMLWASSAEKALAVVELDSLYLGLFVLVGLAVRTTTLRGWCDGLALGIAAIVVLALLSRLFPGLGYSRAQLRFLPAAETRLSFPIGYWNALAVFAALGAPLVLRTAVSSRRFAARAAAVGYLPALVGAVYLTSSRGGAIATGIGVLAFLGLAQRRVLSLFAVLAAAAGAAAVLAVLDARTELVNGPLGAVATRQGHSAFLLILPICVATGVAYAIASRPLRRSFSIGAERAVLAGLAVAVVVALVAVHPLARLHAFERPLTLSEGSQGYITEHLLSSSGNGRWQMWTAAAKQFEAHPEIGAGAGSFESWWAQHRPFALYVKNAHSLYLETLGELGAVGLALVALVVLSGLLSGVRRAFAAEDEQRLVLAALAAAFTSFVVAAGVDWIWQVPAVGAVGIALLALLTSAASASRRPRGPRVRTVPLVARWLAVAVGLAAVAVQVVPLLGNLQLNASASAARRGDPQEALKDAAAARDIEPWASSPYLQLALVEEEAGALAPARADIRRAIRRDDSNWQLWLVAARIETESGAVRAARESLADARRLNPLEVGALSNGQ